MKLLVDQNLPRSLVTHFSAEFPDSIHAASLALDQAPDESLWAKARDNDFTLITKDSDFQQLSFLLGPPPKVIWLRCGNSSVGQIVSLIRGNLPAIQSFKRNPAAALLTIR